MKPSSAAYRPVPNYGIADDFPLMWEKTQQFDFAERLGGCTDPLMAEIDAALREIWMARSTMSAEVEKAVRDAGF